MEYVLTRREEGVVAKNIPTVENVPDLLLSQSSSPFALILILDGSKDLIELLDDRNLDRVKKSKTANYILASLRAFAITFLLRRR